MDGKRSLHRFLARLSHHRGDMLPMETSLYILNYLIIHTLPYAYHNFSAVLPLSCSHLWKLLLCLLSRSRFPSDVTPSRWTWTPFHLPSNSLRLHSSPTLRRAPTMMAFTDESDFSAPPRIRELSCNACRLALCWLLPPIFFPIQTPTSTFHHQSPLTRLESSSLQKLFLSVIVVRRWVVFFL